MTLQELKEEARKEFDNPNILNQTILLNWIRANTNILEKKELRFREILSEFIIDITDSLIDKVYEESRKEMKITEIGINAFSQPSYEVVGKMVIDFLNNKNRIVREEYAPGLFMDYLYLKIHQS